MASMRRSGSNRCRYRRANPASMPLLTVEHLQKSYNGTPAVHDVSFTVEGGEVFGLLGPNGAGKSTTMSMIAGLLHPDGGEIRFDAAESAERGGDSRYLLGFVPQDLAVYPDLTVAENLKFFGSLYRLSGDELRGRVDAALDRVGLTDRSVSLARTLSGGMKRRLNFAAALLHHPKLLILDEPTVGVDPQSRAHLMDCVRDVAAGGMSVIYASHYMEEVEAICHRAAILDHGRVLACDTIEGLLNRVESRIDVVPAAAIGKAKSRVAEYGRCVDEGGEERILIETGGGESELNVAERLTHVLQILVEEQIPVASVATRSANLERLFLDLTGRGLRD
ncbi:MAG: ABC transporter ATP-binding protein [Planctomycetota bacterium]|nr:MAG: ABC transporter ATP-binding protein [Planctomycetota bacterium]REJ95822.1 MAG: ABC transporter ATP-binding protein [Planctomycetota bacterium]REK27271.1 MAG: ABC transporter ATP-binding protein [Planctomycetota bacterium]REK36708.1 MAG: ABC transporter ATP-binding protein [Planctomycetota bacterium]